MLTTRQKVAAARLLSACVRFVRSLAGRDSHARVTRLGIRWQLDLREGIDLSIYCLGAFERRNLRAYSKLIRGGEVIIDVGANVGAHTLHFARLAGPEGRVVAIEPTRWALEKLVANVALNPALAPRVTPKQLFLAGSEDPLEPEIYASWPVAGDDADLHRELRGRKMPTVGASALTLDRLVEELKLTRIDLIKIDVDGNEWQVVSGAHETLRKFRPTLMLELAPYSFTGREEEFGAFVEAVLAHRYTLVEIGTHRELPGDVTQLRSIIRPGAGINAFAFPARP